MSLFGSTYQKHGNSQPFGSLYSSKKTQPFRPYAPQNPWVGPAKNKPSPSPHPLRSHIIHRYRDTVRHRSRPSAFSGSSVRARKKPFIPPYRSERNPPPIHLNCRGGPFTTGNGRRRRAARGAGKPPASYPSAGNYRNPYPLPWKRTGVAPAPLTTGPFELAAITRSRARYPHRRAMGRSPSTTPSTTPSRRSSGVRERRRLSGRTSPARAPPYTIAAGPLEDDFDEYDEDYVEDEEEDHDYDDDWDIEINTLLPEHQDDPRHVSVLEYDESSSELLEDDEEEEEEEEEDGLDVAVPVKQLHRTPSARPRRSSPLYYRPSRSRSRLH